MSRVGRYLIARPTVTPGFFAKSIVFVYEDSARGSAGIALTHPTNLSLRDLAVERGLGDTVYPLPIYRGGPVGISGIVMLHSDEFTSSNTLHTGSGFDISSDDIMIEKMAHGVMPVRCRLAAGAAVWVPGQLDSEIARGHWLVSDLDPEIVFGLDKDEQWAAAIESAGSQIIARYF